MEHAVNALASGVGSRYIFLTATGDDHCVAASDRLSMSTFFTATVVDAMPSGS
jgi:hypothetical protein